MWINKQTWALMERLADAAVELGVEVKNQAESVRETVKIATKTLERQAEVIQKLQKELEEERKPKITDAQSFADQAIEHIKESCSGAKVEMGVDTSGFEYDSCRPMTMEDVDWLSEQRHETMFWTEASGNEAPESMSVQDHGPAVPPQHIEEFRRMIQSGNPPTVGLQDGEFRGLVWLEREEDE